MTTKQKISTCLLVVLILTVFIPFMDKAYAADNGLSAWIADIYKWSLSIVASLAVLVLIYAGYLYATSAGSPEQVNLAKEYIIGAIAGMLLLFLAVIIYNMLKVEDKGTGFEGTKNKVESTVPKPGPPPKGTLSHAPDPTPASETIPIPTPE